MRVCQCNTAAVSDCIPVDLVVNSVLAAAWYTVTYKPESTQIYNITTGTTNPHTWRQMSKYKCHDTCMMIYVWMVSWLQHLA